MCTQNTFQWKIGYIWTKNSKKEYFIKFGDFHQKGKWLKFQNDAKIHVNLIRFVSSKCQQVVDLVASGHFGLDSNQNIQFN